MDNEFIDSTISFLKRIDLNLSLPSIKELNVTQKEDSKTLHLEGEDVAYIGQTPINNNIFLHIIIFFGLLDSYIDKNNQQFEGYSFAKKYRNMPNNTDLEIIIKELYRVLKIFRNTVIHSKSHLIQNENDLMIDYYYRSTQFHIDTNVSALELIYSAIIFIIKNNIYPLNYNTGLLRSYYDKINSNINNLKDDLPTPELNNISSEIRLKPNLRYQIKDANYNSLNNNTIRIPRSENEDVVKGCEFDYIINLNNKNYILPNELLNNNNRKIEINELEFWELKIQFDVV